MPPSPYVPWVDGVPVVTLDDAGNTVEQQDPSIKYYEGRYYPYTEKWLCGRLSFFSGLIPNVSTTALKYPTGDYGGTCGFAVYSSLDLIMWTHERDFYPDVATSSMQKPHVLYSNVTKQFC